MHRDDTILQSNKNISTVDYVNPHMGTIHDFSEKLKEFTMFSKEDVAETRYRLEAFEKLNKKFDSFIHTTNEYLDQKEDFSIELNEYKGYISLDIFNEPIFFELSMILFNSKPLGKLEFHRKASLGAAHKFEKIWEIYFDENGNFKADLAGDFLPSKLTDTSGAVYCIISLADKMLKKITSETGE